MNKTFNSLRNNRFLSPIRSSNKENSKLYNEAKLLQINESQDKETENILKIDNFEGINVHAVSISPITFTNTFHPLTNFDFTNKDKDRENEGFNFNSFNNNSSSNFLNQRKTVTYNQKGFFFPPIKINSRKKLYNFTIDKVKNTFLSPDDNTRYSKYFFPNPGFGILQKPISNKSEKSIFKSIPKLIIKN